MQNCFNLPQGWQKSAAQRHLDRNPPGRPCQLESSNSRDYQDHVTEPHWLLLAADHEDFEEAAIAICELVSRCDERIGKTTLKAVQFTS